MNRPGSPGLSRRRALVPVLGIALLTAACGSAGADVPPVASVPWVTGVGGTVTVGIDAAPTGCNPNTVSGATWATRLVLEPVLPSAFVVSTKDEPVYDSAVIDQAELQSTSPQTVVYTINPKAVWSDGVAITAADFVYTWHQERGVQGPVGAGVATGGPSSTGTGSQTTTTIAPPVSSTTTAPASTAPAPTTPSSTAAPVGPSTDTPTATDTPGATATTGPSMGYRQIGSMTPSNHGRTVTVVFKTPYADWQSLFNDLLPAHVLEKTGWDPSCSTIDPSIDLSGGPFVIQQVTPGKIVLARNPHWWGQVPDLDRLVIRIASGPQQLDQWLRAGTIQVALPQSFGEPFLEDASGLPTLQSATQVSTTFLQLEFSTTSTVTGVTSVREAIAHAVDRQSLVDTVTGWAASAIVPSASHIFGQDQDGYPQPRQQPAQVTGQAGYPVPSPPSLSNPAQPFPTTADLPTTGKLLADAGDVRGADGRWELPGGQPFSVRMAVDQGDPWAARTATLLVHQLAAAGITVSVIGAPSAATAGTDLSSGAADMALLPMHASPFASEAIAWYTPLLGPPGQYGSQDWTNFDDPSLDSLLVKASQQLNPVTAAPMYTQADNLLWREMVALPLFAEPATLGWSSLVGGITQNPNGAGLLWSPEAWGLLVPPTSPKTAPG